MAKFYIDYHHKYIDLKDLTFTDYINCDYRLANQIFQAYVDDNGLVLTDVNREQLREQFRDMLWQNEREYA